LDQERLVIGPFGFSSAKTAKSLPVVSGERFRDSDVGVGLSTGTAGVPAKRLARIVIMSMQDLRAASGVSQSVVAGQHKLAAAVFPDHAPIEVAVEDLIRQPFVVELSAKIVFFQNLLLFQPAFEQIIYHGKLFGAQWFCFDHG
jgi:hypothetical protein